MRAFHDLIMATGVSPFGPQFVLFRRHLMKISLTATSLMCLLMLAGPSTANSQTKGDRLCALFSVFDYPPDALFYCDLVSDTCDWLDVSYYFGPATTPAPYVNCPDDCVAAKAKSSGDVP